MVMALQIPKKNLIIILKNCNCSAVHGYKPRLADLHLDCLNSAFSFFLLPGSVMYIIHLL